MRLWPVAIVVLMPGVALADSAGHGKHAECEAFVQDQAASHSPKLWAQVGLCKLRLERDGEAIDAYSHYLQENPDLSVEEHDRIVGDVQELEVNAGHVTIGAKQLGVVIEDARIPADGENIVNRYGPIDGKLYLRMRPGRHILTTKLPGYEESRWEIEILPSMHAEQEFDLRPVELVPLPPRMPGRGERYGPWMVMGLGAAAMISGTATGIVSASDGHSGSRGIAVATDLLLIGGALIASGGLTWLLLERRREGLIRF